MVKLAIDDNPDFAVSTIEIDREGPSYSYETLDQLSAENPGAELFFILGGDSLADLPNWRLPGRILELATLAVAGRPESAGPGTDAARLGARLACIDMPEMALSSSDVRARASAGATIRYLVPPAVEGYISSHRLY
jgi:nicotinate-nucleotide adenylyltransferase